MLRPLDRRVIQIAVERRLEHALMDLDRVEPGGFRAAALPFEVIAKRRVVGVIAGRGEAIAEVAGRPVAGTHADAHVPEELDGLLAIEIAGQAGGVRELVG